MCPEVDRRRNMKRFHEDSVGLPALQAFEAALMEVVPGILALD